MIAAAGVGATGCGWVRSLGFIEEANKFDAARVKNDAEIFQLYADWQAVQVPAACP